MTVDIPLVPGWNLIAVSVKHTPGLTAQAALDAINSQGGACSEVDRWRNGGWDAHINGLPFNDFAIELGRGYFVKCTAAVTWSVTGELIMAPVPLGLTPGWNLVALPYGPHADQAQAWLNDIIAQSGTATEVDRWHNGGWDAHINGLPFNDFAISKTRGYFIKMGNSISYVPEPPAQDVCGTISTNTTWTSDKIWRITCDVTVSNGVTLSVEPETAAKPSSNSIKITINGILLAQGSYPQRVFFTSLKDDSVGGDTNNDGDGSAPGKADWVGIKVTAGASATFDYAKIAYGGYYQYPYGAYGSLHVNGGSAILRHSTIAQSGNSYAASGGVIHADSGASLTISDSTISDGYIGSNGVGLRMDGGTLSVIDTTFDSSGTYGIYLDNMATPTIANNTFRNHNGYALRISLNSSTTTSFANISNNSTINNGRNALIVTGAIGHDMVWPATTGLPYLIGYGTTLTINTGAILTIETGAVVKFESTQSILLVNGNLIAQGTGDDPVFFTSVKDDSVGGDTNNDGDGSAPGKADWGGIKVVSEATATLDYTAVTYGGYYSGYPSHGLEGSLYINGGSLTLRHGVVTQSGNSYASSYGAVYADSNATVNISDSTISDNYHGSSYAGLRVNNSALSLVMSNITGNQYGLHLTSPTSLDVSHNNIFGNNSYGLYNANSAQLVIAHNNWWGSDHGPAPYGSGNAINYRTCYDSVRRVYYICQYYADVDPWLGQSAAIGSQLGHAGPTSRDQAFVADPVNTANGNYAYSYTDLNTPTRGLPLGFVRAYNSLDPKPGALGFGWTHNWNLKLAEDNNSVTVAFGDGHMEKWTWTGTAYAGDPGVFGVLVKNGDNSFSLTQKDQVVYHFDPAGKLAWAEDRNANRTTLAYDGNGRLITVTEPAGRVLTFEYASPVDPTLISRIVDQISRSILYTYDSTNNLVTVTDVTGQATSMTYDANHRLLTITDANSHTFVTNVYDVNGRVIEQYDADGNKWTFAYDEPGHFTLVTDPRTFVTTYTYDGDWRLMSEKDALNFIVSYNYDADSNRTQVLDKRGFLTRYEYDDRGNTTKVTDALNGITTMTYDISGTQNNLLSQSDSLGRTTSYVYNANSNLIQRTDAAGGVSTWTYDAYGQPATATDANTHTTTTVYDAYGNLTSTTDAAGHTISAIYDAAGRKLSETDALGRTISFTHDLANRLEIITEPLGKTTAYDYDAVGNQTRITENGTQFTDYSYDAKDRLVSVTDPLGHTTTYTYDMVDNQISVTDPLGHVTTFTYDALNRRTSVKDALNHTTRYQYDANGNLIRLTDANNKVTTYAYDALGQLTGVTDSAGGTVSYGYDAVGNRTSMTDANSHTTTYNYDTLNRLTIVADPLGHVVSDGYDAVGNRTSQTKADGTVRNYDYDVINRLVSITYPGGTINYTYDAVSNRTSMTDPSGTTTYTYDDLDRLIQVAGPQGTLGYGYDLFDNRTTLTYPGNLTVNYAYDLANRLISVTDHASRITQYTYDDANRFTGINYPNGIQATYSYDDADRLLSITHLHPTNGVIASASYTLDTVGNRLTMTDPDGTTSYSYDNLHRLTQVIYPGGETVTYAYDPMGNRTSLVSSVHGTTTYTYDNADRLLAYTEPGGTVSLSWDDNGRMTAKGTATYTYDPLDRLTQVVDGATIVQFGYNGDGVRQSKTVTSTTTSYLQDLQAALPMVLSETTNGQTSLHLHGNDLLAQIDLTGDPTYQHVDGLGSIRARTNGMGLATATLKYDAFGALRSFNGVPGTFRFAGEQADDEVSLIFLRARYFDPHIGRFISADPFPGFKRDPQSLNKYAYAQNNPVGNVDPQGTSIIDKTEKWVHGGAILTKGLPVISKAIAFNKNLPQMEKDLTALYQPDFSDPKKIAEWSDRVRDPYKYQIVTKTALSGYDFAASVPNTSFTGPIVSPSSAGDPGEVGRIINYISDLYNIASFILGSSDELPDARSSSQVLAAPSMSLPPGQGK